MFSVRFGGVPENALRAASDPAAERGHERSDVSGSLLRARENKVADFLLHSHISSPHIFLIHFIGTSASIETKSNQFIFHSAIS